VSGTRSNACLVFSGIELGRPFAALTNTRLDRGTHTLIQMDRRNPLTKIRLMSSGFTPVLFTHNEMGVSWIRLRHVTGPFLRKQKSDPKHQR